MMLINSRGFVVRLIALTAVLFLGACTNTKVVNNSGGQGLVSEGEVPKVLLMPLDVELSVLTATGLTEPNAEWTKNANEYMVKAIKEELKTRESDFSIYASDETDPNSTLLQLERLHQAVGVSILVHHYGPNKLPSKRGIFDWSLGEDVKELKAATGADYALFVFVRDSYASGGRVAAQIGLALLGVGMTGGVQIGFSSLVDLNSGEIVWFNRLVSTSGDLRKQGPANKTVRALLKGLPAA